ncbi:Phytochrome two-component sensor histidine kinase Cyanobacterial phytochrome B [Paramagnetospirillum magnetotacticum MS-1]|uniref:histidine kinase n=1 Tax=Paramagnetospirillum magnetotacticum MS-1 TaxID=272627 RepID=A0A0C2V4I7_PARME|nr:PAS domain-containing sensor histidine kinase [Paramagnetospirillum magnetotacticum]KIL99996.1 Phytochrome two-component sensor histidine kinase Cyanobacterial phytochrome B [Paramagnetospirillum magnetotacticum MS-1]
MFVVVKWADGVFMGLAILRSPGLTAGMISKPRERIAVRMGLLFAALAACLAAIMALAVWSLWPDGGDRSIGWLLAGLVPLLVGLSFGLGMAIGQGVDRRLARLDGPRPAGGGEWWNDPLGLDGALADLLGQFQSTVREVEQRGRSLIADVERVAQLGLAERDLTTDTGIWSDEFHAILGLTPGGCVPSHAAFLEVVHPGDRAEVDEILRAVCAEGGRREADFRILRSDGEIRMLHGSMMVSCDAAGRPVRADSTIQDITERKHLENELDGLIRELWRSNEELEQFAYVASHDLRQPLRVVGSYVSLLEEELVGSLGGESLEYMGFVRDGVRRMDRLITDLLAYSRVGRVGGDAPFPVAEAVESALSDLQIEIEDSGAVVSVTSTLPTLYGDRGEMERLFGNLIGNALKYRRPDEAPRVSVECEDLGGEWLFRVRDNGIGIPPEHAERVFGIFQRLHARDEYEGTGVGLAIVKKIVDRHGGSARVEPQDGPGTVLAFNWPKGPRQGEAEG